MAIITEKEASLGTDRVARRRNDLITGKYRLSVQAHRLFLCVLARVEDHHDENTEYDFTVYELAKEIGIDRAHLYKTIVEVLDELSSTIVNLRMVKNGEVLKDRFARVGFIKNRQEVRVKDDGSGRLAGSIRVSLHPEMLVYVQSLDNRYTLTELKYAFRLGSSYSQRLYDLLKSEVFKGRAWRVERQELFGLLDVKKGSFELFGDFRRYVLERACDEITLHTDLGVALSYEKSGQTVTHVVFHLLKVGGDKVDLLPGTQEYQVFKGMVDLGIGAKAAQQLIAEWWPVDPELLRWHLAEAKKKQAIGVVRSAVGWFKAGLRKDFRPQRSLLTAMRQKAEAVREDYKKTGPRSGEVIGALQELADQLGSLAGPRV